MARNPINRIARNPPRRDLFPSVSCSFISYPRFGYTVEVVPQIGGRAGGCEFQDVKNIGKCTYFIRGLRVAAVFAFADNALFVAEKVRDLGVRLRCRQRA